MPTINTHEHDRTGDYSIACSDGEAQKLRYYGILPDNGILVNKLINNLGRNLLALEKESVEVNNNKVITDELKREINFHAEMEKESNRYTMQVLDCLADLEKGEPDLNKDKKFQRRQFITRIEELYKERLNTDLFGSMHSLPGSLFDEREMYKNELGRIKQHLIDLLNDEKTDIRSIYREVMESFAGEQRLISIFQHNSARVLTYANRSLTEAYQNASYAMEKHVFSTEKPTDEQLWRGVQQKGNLVINTANYPSMRKEDALFAACFLKNQETEY